MIDMNPHHLEMVNTILAEHVPECEVRAFGSRATWTAKDYSDLDLAVVGKGPLDWKALGHLKEAFEASNLPMRVDVLDWHSISESFRKVIMRDCVVIQKRGMQIKTGRWRTAMMNDVIALTLSSVDKRTKPNEHAVKLCNYTDVYNNSFIHAGMDFMKATATEREISRCTLFEGDVVITKDSEKYDDIGVPAVVREYIPDLVCGYHLAILRPMPDEIDGKYLFYALNTREVQHQFHAYANGVTRFGLRKADIGRIEIPLPPLAEQRRVARILGALDDKIELNRRMNATLEGMARALFKSWFVDFEPVRAKMEGRWSPGESLPGMPAELYDLFPDRLVPSEIGEVPEGWEVGVLDDAVELLSGGTPKTATAEYWNGDIPWYTAKDAPAPNDVFVVDTERKITQAGIDNSATKMLPPGTTIISARGTVGRLACLGIPMTMNQTCYGIRGVNGYPDYFTYWNIRMAVDELQQRTHGTIFDTITRQTFKLVATTLPPVSLAGEFEKTTLPTMNRILVNLHESQRLAVLRDTLLPGLVTGQLRAS